MPNPRTKQKAVIINFNDVREKKTFELACFKLFGVRGSQQLRSYGRAIIGQFLENFEEPTDEELGLEGEQPDDEKGGVEL